METVAHRSPAKSDRLSLFVFIDAFGWELVQHYPFLDDLLTVKAPLGTVFGYSSTYCHPVFCFYQFREFELTLLSEGRVRGAEHWHKN